MKKSILFVVIQSCLLHHNEAFRNKHIARRRQQGLDLLDFEPSRRVQHDPYSLGSIVGAPMLPNHLPEAEAILPGHTLLKPTFGMLKSSVSFPHRELEGGFGVDGNYDNLGITYDGKNERVLYSGFRRMPLDYLMVVPKQSKSSKPSFDLTSLVLDLEKDKNYKAKLLDILNKNINKPRKNNLQVYFVKTDSRKPLSTPSFYVRDESNDIDSNEINYYLKPKKQTSVNNFFNTQKKFIYLRSDESNSLEKLKGLNMELDNDTEENEKSWIEKARALFTTIKIRPNAPEYTDLVPRQYLESLKKTRTSSKWFFNQHD